MECCKALKKKKIVSSYPIVKLGKTTHVAWGNTSLTKEVYKDTGYSAFSATGQDGYTDFYEYEGNGIVLSAIGALCGKCFWAENQWSAIKNTITIQLNTENNLRYLYYIVDNNPLWTIGGSAQPFITQENVKRLPIPLPPLDEQNRIVDLMQVQDDIITTNKTQIDELKNQIKSIDLSSYPMKRFGDYIFIDPPKTSIQTIVKSNPQLEVSYIPMEDISTLNSFYDLKQNKPIQQLSKGYSFFEKGDVLLAKITPCFENGKSAIVRDLKNNIGFGSTEFLVLRSSKDILKEYLYWHISHPEFITNGKEVMTGSSGHKRLPKSYILNLKIPVPTIEEQEKIVLEINNYESQIDTLNQQITTAKAQQKTIMSDVFTIEDVV